MTSTVRRKLRQLAKGLTAEDLRALAVECRLPEAAVRQLLVLIDELIAEHHDALLDRIELRINEAARDAAL